MKTLLIRSLAMTALMLAGLVAPAWAVDYTWTNTVSDGASGYWTNAAHWRPNTGYPAGGATGDRAFLTNGLAGAYTNLLDSSLTTPLATVVLSNSLGQAWLVVTNASLVTTGAIGTVGLNLGNGARVRLDNGASLVLSNQLRTQTGTSVIYLNAGSTLWVGSSFAVGTGVAGATTTVTSVSGLGGQLVVSPATNQFLMSGQNSGGNFNRLIISNVTVTAGAFRVGYLIGGPNLNLRTNVNNSAWVTGPDTRLDLLAGGMHIGLGINASTNLVGSPTYFTIATNHQLLVDNGASVSNGGPLFIGFTQAATDYANSFTTSAYNRVEVRNATWTNLGNVFVGFLSSNNVSAGLSKLAGHDNTLLVSDGATFWAATNVTVGNIQRPDPSFVAFNNALIVSNGAALTIGQTLQLGINGASNNQFVVTGPGSAAVVGQLLVTSNNHLRVHGGTLTIIGFATNEHPVATVIGDGVQAAALVLSGTNTASYFAGGLVITNNAALRGVGTLANAVTVNAGGTLFPGLSPGRLSMTGALDLQTNSTLFVEVGGSPLQPGVDFDQLVVGSLTLGGGTLTGAVVAAVNVGDLFVIVEDLSLTPWAAGNEFFGMTNGATFFWGGTGLQIQYDFVAGGDSIANDIALIVIPEPSALALAGLGLLGWWALRRYRL